MDNEQGKGCAMSENTANIIASDSIEHRRA